MIAESQRSLQRQVAEAEKRVKAAEQKATEAEAIRDAIIQYGEDSEEYKRWYANFLVEKTRQEERAALAAERLELARERAEAKGVPPELLEGVTSHEAIAALIRGFEHARSMGGASAPAPAGGSEPPEAPSEEPQAPVTVTQGGTGAAMTSKQEWLNRYADEVGGGIPATPENARYADQLLKEGLIPQPRR
jgi:hypothetical protein